MASNKNPPLLLPSIAALMSLMVPGLGHFPIGRDGRGVLFFIIGIGAYMAIPPLGFIIALAAGIDAYQIAAAARAAAAAQQQLLTAEHDARIAALATEVEAVAMGDTDTDTLFEPSAIAEPHEQADVRALHFGRLSSESMWTLLETIVSEREKGQLTRSEASEMRASLTVDLALYGSPDSDEAILGVWREAVKQRCAVRRDLSRVSGALQVRPD